MDKRDEHAADEQEDTDVEGDGADQLKGPELDDLLARPGMVRERRLAEGHWQKPDCEREQEPAHGDDRRVAQDREAPLGARRAERHVAQRDRQRDDHARREAVAHVRVALNDDRRGDHDSRAQQAWRHHVDDRAHQLLPRRSRLETPTTATANTVISTIVSSPRKSARITVTTSPPCASCARAMCWAASPRSALVRESVAQIAAKDATPAPTPASTLRRRRARGRRER